MVGLPMEISDEKEKILYEHKLTVRRIIIEKILFLIAVIIVGFIANIMIEQYRQHQTQQRFFLEKKFDAVTNLRKDYATMLNFFGKFSLPDQERIGLLSLPTNYKDLYLSSIEAMSHTCNHFGSVLSEIFTEQLFYQTLIYHGIYINDVSKGRKYRTFVFVLADDFDNLCKQELGLPSLTPTTRFEFSKWTTEKADARGTSAFLHENFEKWVQQEQKLKRSGSAK